MNHANAAGAANRSAKTSPASIKAFSHDRFTGWIEEHCTSCHDAATAKGKLNIEAVIDGKVGEHTAVWEAVFRKVASRQMPPLDKPRPKGAEYAAASAYLEAALDAASRANPHPGRTDTFRRLNRTEYQNAIRDLLTLQIDAAAMLPADESSHGFDHITVGDLTPVLLRRYVLAAQKISRQAIGAPQPRPDAKTYRIKPDITQDRHVPGLPLGTRGGALFRHHFPRDGVYEIAIRLMRDRDEKVEGLRGSHQLEVLIDRKRLAGFTVAPPRKPVANHFDDSQLKAKVRVKAGPRELGVTFIQNDASLEETKRQPLNVAFNAHRHPRLGPAIYQVSVIGPLLEGDDEPISSEQAIATMTPSRQRIFGDVPWPRNKHEADAAAKKVIARLARRAYRRPITEADIEQPLRFFREAYATAGYEAGIERALSAILVNPNFLLKIERDAKDAEPGKPYAISDVELASRLSFFLWSSIPDDALLRDAERGRLRDRKVLSTHVRRMLADPHARSLATNFAGQWLHLRNLDAKTPDGRLYPDFDENLRVAMRRETELHVEEVIREDRSVLRLIRTNHTYLNERLAKHYGIPHVYGSRFRRVDLPKGSKRGGLLRQGSILTVTSYATRTSPVVRGNWVLENLLGAAAPPPPDNVPPLESQKIATKLSLRERLAEHRNNAACASCHKLIDPVGFALEHFDAVGQWRDLESGKPVDAKGSLPDGSTFEGVNGLEAGILNRPTWFVTAMTEKLLTYALGRGLTHHDGPAVRRIVRDAAKQDYRFAAIVMGIVESEPFQRRATQDAARALKKRVGSE